MRRAWKMRHPRQSNNHVSSNLAPLRRRSTGRPARGALNPRSSRVPVGSERAKVYVFWSAPQKCLPQRFRRPGGFAVCRAVPCVHSGIGTALRHRVDAPTAEMWKRHGDRTASRPPRPPPFCAVRMATGAKHVVAVCFLWSACHARRFYPPNR